MLRNSLGWIGIVPAVACTLALAGARIARADGPTSPTIAATEAQSGMRYNVDPKTGALLPDVPDEPVAPRAAEPLPAPMPAPGGGMMIVLPASHTHSFEGSLDPAGHPRGECDAAASAAAGGR